MLNRLVSSQSSSGNNRDREHNRNRQDRNGNNQGEYVPPIVTFSISDAPYLTDLPPRLLARPPLPARPQSPARPLPIPRFETGTRSNRRGIRTIYTTNSGQVRNQRTPSVANVHPLPPRPNPFGPRLPSYIPLRPQPLLDRRPYRRPSRAIPIVRPPPDYSPTRLPPPPYSNTDENATMSRAGTRPTHIPMPTGNGVSPNGGRSPNGSPLPTPQGATSPTSPRNSFLPSFIRTRSRAATLTGGRGGRSSPTVEAANPLGGSRPGVSRTPSHTGEPTNVTRSASTPQGMAQATNANTGTTDSNPKQPAVSSQVKARINAAQPPRDTPITTYRIRLVPHLKSTRSLAFDPVTREMLPILCPPGITPTTVAHNLENVPNALNGRPPALILKVGRFTEKTATAPQTAGTAQTTTAGLSTDAIGQGPMSAVIANSGGGGDICSSRVAFKSKVVSRSHAEIWCEPNGKVSPTVTLSSKCSRSVLHPRYIE